MNRKLWIRKCISFEEEEIADREFWCQFTPSERVAIAEEMRLGERGNNEEIRDAERLRGTLRVLEAPWS